MLDKGIQFDERPRIEQRLDPLAGQQLALRSLALHRGGSGSVQCLLAQRLQGFEEFAGCVLAHGVAAYSKPDRRKL